MSSAQVPQDRTDKIATDERHAWPRKVTLDARLRVFTADRTHEPRVVRLFPPESCSCPAKTSCYHITAARSAVGLSDSGTRRPLNLTRRNKRRRDSCGQDVRAPAEASAGRRRRYRACRWRVNGADCHHYGELAAAAAAAISNSCGRGTKQPAGAKFTYTNVQAGNARRRHKGATPRRGSSTGYSVTPAASGWLHNVCAGIGRTTPQGCF